MPFQFLFGQLDTEKGLNCFGRDCRLCLLWHLFPGASLAMPIIMIIVGRLWVVLLLFVVCLFVVIVVIPLLSQLVSFALS